MKGNDLIMFTIGMLMAIGVSFFGMFLAYFSYTKRHKDGSGQDRTEGESNG
jgi:hypothetical protein